MNSWIRFLVIVLVACLTVAFTIKPSVPKVLLMTKTTGYHHSSIPKGIEAVEKLGAENGFEVVATTDSALFTQEHLKNYAAIIFLSTTGNLFNWDQKAAIQKYMRAGGGFVGVHAATDTEYGWPWYNQMIGAWFESHPKEQVARLIVKDKKHLATKHLPEVWQRKDEWYNFKNISPDIKVLLTLDEGSYQGGKNGDFHPMAWYHSFEGGRVFYTGLGHTDASYEEPLFLKHLLGGIQYAMGNKK